MKSLLSSFRAQKAKGTKSIGTGKGRRDMYVSKWFAFKYMLFLADRGKPTGTVDTIYEDQGKINDESSHDDGEGDIGVYEDTPRFDDEDDYKTAETIIRSQGNGNETINPNMELEDNQKEALEVAVNCETPTANNQSAKEISLVSSISHTKKKILSSGRSRRKAAENKKEDHQLDRAFELLEKAASKSAKHYEGSGRIPDKSDKHMNFALHIVEKLREYSSVTVSHVQYEINKILFAADLGHYEKTVGIALIPHSHGSQAPEPLLYESQPPTPYSYGSPEQMPTPQQQNKPKTEIDETDDVALAGL